MRWTSWTLLALVLVLTGCDGEQNHASGGSDPGDNDDGLAQGEVSRFAMTQNLGSVTFEKETGDTMAARALIEGNTINLTVAFGSAAYQHPDDDAGIIYTATDRGPTVACDDSETLGIEDFCGAGVAGRVFARPDFAPRLSRFTLSLNGMIEREDIFLTDRDGERLTGLPNDLPGTEVTFGPDGQPLAYDNDGLDVEDLIKLDDDKGFWLAEEYGPSLVHVSPDGEILARIVPTGVKAELENGDQSPNYPVMEGLPAILAKRPLNRGIEALAVSPDNEALYFAVQSPLANPDAGTYAQSRNVRLFKVALDPDDGGFRPVESEYLYTLDAPSTFAHGDRGDTDKAQKDVKVSAMSALAEDQLVILERISDTTKLYRVSLDGATDFYTSAWDSTDTSPSLEQTVVPTLLDKRIRPLRKALVFNTLNYQAGAFANKLEGVAPAVDADYLFLINDNDFGVAGATTQGHWIRLPAGLGEDATAPGPLALSTAGSHATGAFDEGAAEIVAADPERDQLFVVNAQKGTVDVLTLGDEGSLTFNRELDLRAALDAGGLDMEAGAANSVAVYGNRLAVAVENATKTDNGAVALFSASDYTPQGAVEVGPLPDMLTFTPDGDFLLVANEGEPTDYEGGADPEGSISRISLTDLSATRIGFADFNAGGPRADELPDGVRVFGPGASVAQDLEPEYIAVSPDATTAVVSLQENNALAVLNLDQGTVIRIVALGDKNHGKTGNALAASENSAEMRSWEGLHGLYQPDAIALYEWNDELLVVTANEGDAREYDGLEEESRVADLDLDTAVLDAAIQDNTQLGRLKVTTTLGDDDGDHLYQALYAFGARSFSIFDLEGNRLYDSGQDFEAITASLLPDHFNADNDDNTPQARNDDKGPEPEGLTLGAVDGRLYAFVGLERVGGIMMYDITDPFGVQFVDYINNRDFEAAPSIEVNGAIQANPDAGDLAPEGLSFFHYNGRAWLAVGNEVSGTTTVFEVSAPQE